MYDPIHRTGQVALLVIMFIAVFFLAVTSEGCASAPAPPLLPAADFEIKSGPCGIEYHASVSASTSAAIGDTGFIHSQTTESKHRIHKRCKEEKR